MRRYRTQRDAQADAESAEAHAKRVNTDAAWQVAADAWEIAGNMRRARHATLRQPGFGSETRRRLAAWQAAEREFWRKDQRFRRGGLSREEVLIIDRAAGTTRPTNEEISELEVADFLRDPPLHLFAYYSDDSDLITNFMGAPLGEITRRGARSRAFGRGTFLQHVTVTAINGYYYSGTCNLETGTYCKLKRGKVWRRR